MLRVNHGQGTCEGTAVDQEVEVDVDAGRSGSRVDNLLGAIFPDADIGLLVLVLLSNEGRNIRLETTGTDTHDDETNGKDGDGGTGLGDNLGNGGEDEEDMSDDGDQVGPLNSGVTTQVLISNPRSTERGDVGPELVDCTVLAGCHHRIAMH